MQIAIQYIPIERVNRTGKGSKDQMEIQDWGTNQNLWKTIIMKMRSTGKLFIVICHEEAIKDEISGGVTKWVPNIPGSKLQAAFPGFFSDVWRTEIETGKDNNPSYVVRVKPTARLDLGGSIGFDTPTIVRSNNLQEQSDMIAKLVGYNQPVPVWARKE